MTSVENNSVLFDLSNLHILDVRPMEEFERLHLACAVNIPLEELPRRMHELPSKTEQLSVFDTSEDRALHAQAELSRRGRKIVRVFFGEKCLVSGVTQTGPSKVRLWRPHLLLEQALGFAKDALGSFEGRSALDMACGSGRDAVFLAMAGFSAEAWDVLPDAVAMCRELAARNGVAVATAVRDMRMLPIERVETFDLISCFYYLHRPLMEYISKSAKPGSMVVLETFVDPQREIHGRPKHLGSILRWEELRNLFSHWTICLYREGEVEPGRIAASLIARKT